MQFQVRAFKDRALAYRELTTAGVALVKAKSFNAVRVLLAGLAADAFESADFAGVMVATEGADWTIGPQDFLQCLKGRCFIVEICLV